MHNKSGKERTRPGKGTWRSNIKTGAKQSQAESPKSILLKQDSRSPEAKSRLNYGGQRQRRITFQVNSDDSPVQNPDNLSVHKPNAREVPRTATGKLQYKVGTCWYAIEALEAVGTRHRPVLRVAFKKPIKLPSGLFHCEVHLGTQKWMSKGSAKTPLMAKHKACLSLMEGLRTLPKPKKGIYMKEVVESVVTERYNYYANLTEKSTKLASGDTYQRVGPPMFRKGY